MPYQLKKLCLGIFSTFNGSHIQNEAHVGAVFSEDQELIEINSVLLAGEADLEALKNLYKKDDVGF